MKNVKLALIAAVVGVMTTGCASSIPTPLSPMGGDRAAGTVIMSRTAGIFGGGKIDWVGSQRAASESCKRWGYESAEKFGAMRKTCSSRDMNGTCWEYQEEYNYQCVGHLEK